jgi:hypothetical protein
MSVRPLLVRFIDTREVANGTAWRTAHGICLPLWTVEAVVAVVGAVGPSLRLENKTLSFLLVGLT